MINDNKKDFMNAVSIEAEDFRSRAFAASIENFVKSIVKEATTIEVPKGATQEVKAKIASEVKATIDAIGKEISNNAINNDYEELYNVDIAKEIVNPKSFNESIQKIIAEGVYDEAEERAQLLAIQFDNNKFAGANFDDVHAHVKKTFASEAFDSRFDIGVNVREQIKYILSVEGESIVEEIKNEVTTLVEETEEKNNVVREAVTEITALKEEIEDRINGEDGGGDIEDDNSGDDGELGGEEPELDDMGGNPEQSGEALAASVATFTAVYLYTLSVLFILFNLTYGKKALKDLKPILKKYFDKQLKNLLEYKEDLKKVDINGLENQFREINPRISIKKLYIYKVLSKGSFGDRDIKDFERAGAERFKVAYKLWKAGKLNDAGKIIDGYGYEQGLDIKYDMFIITGVDSQILDQVKTSINNTFKHLKSDNKINYKHNINAKKLEVTFSVSYLSIKDYNEIFNIIHDYKSKSRKEQKEIRNELAKEDLYQIFQGTNLSNNYSKETFNSAFDRDSFSREAAEEILDNFRELDDGIDTDDVPETEDTLSVGENIEPDDTDEDNSDIESTEKTYIDDEDDYIEVDESAFKYDEPIEKEELSEESMARDILPLSYKKIYGNDIKISKKLPIYLALTHGRGTEFFNYIRNRRIHMENLLSKESTAIVDGVPKEDIEKRLDNVTDIVGKIEADVETLTEDFSIIGILEGKSQRAGDKIQNALTSVFKPGVLKNKTESMSKEELYEHELADIFKLGLQIAEVTNDITDGIDVSGNKDQLGYLEELLNEKMFEIPEVDKFEVETKIKALQSIESVVDIKDVVDMQAFIAEKEAVKVDKVRLDSIKDIDAYGFSYVDEITKIKANLKEKLADRFIETNRVKHNVDIDKIVDLVVEEVDTTKTDSNLYEGVISKLVENKDITSSVEGLIIKNKSKVLTTGYIAGDKLGMLTKDDIQDIRNHLI